MAATDASPSIPPASIAESWLAHALEKHHALAPAAAQLVRAQLDNHGIQYLAVTHRVKTLASARDKILRKEYSAPERQMTDLSGVRVVTYLESEVDKATAVLSRLFTVDPKNSSTSPDRLGTDKIGYRSLHLVCRLSAEQCNGELATLANLTFEIQVRTVLQHAWAELAHDNSFKIDVSLPDALQRKLNLHSAMLELVDRGFQEIYDASQAYRRGLTQRTDHDLLDQEFNSISAYEYLDRIARERGLVLSGDLDKSVINEAISFGIDKVGDLHKLATDAFFSRYRAQKGTLNTYRGLLRVILMDSDLEKYLTQRRGWDGMLDSTYRLLIEHYGRDRVDRILGRHEIDVLKDDY